MKTGIDFGPIHADLLQLRDEAIEIAEALRDVNAELMNMKGQVERKEEEEKCTK
jgi:hypothetical protein